MYVVLKVQNLNGSRLVIVFLFNEKINTKMKSKRKLLQLEMCWGIFLCKRNLSAKADGIWRAKRNKSLKERGI